MLYLIGHFFGKSTPVTEPAPIESPPAEQRSWPRRLWDRLGGGDRRAVLPRLGPRPRFMVPVYGVLLLSAWLVLQPASRAPWSSFPGNVDSPDAAYALNNHWFVRSHGLLASSNSRMLAFPVGEDRFVSSGFPLDVLAAWPLTSALGWPAGFTVFLVLVFWAAGAAMAWLAGRWWRSAWAAAVAGVAYQTSGVLLLEASRGCYANVLGAVFVPLALGLLARALMVRSKRDALLAGLFAGLATLSYWYLGLYVGLGMLVLVLLAFLERRFPWRVCLVTLVGLVVVVGLPLVYVGHTMAEAPGHDIEKWDMILTGQTEQALVRWVAGANSLLSRHIPEGLLAIRPVLWMLLLLGVWRQRQRRWMAPAVWLTLGLALAAGPWVELPGGDLLLPGPALGLMDSPVLRRMWWPYRALLLAAPAVALLAGGGAAQLHRQVPRLRQLAAAVFARLSSMEVEHSIHKRWVPHVILHLGYLLVALLLGEAFLMQPLLPLVSTPARPSTAAALLAMGKGPVLEVPFGNTPMRKDTSMFADQLFHRRPLLNSPVFPHASLSTLRMRRSPTWPALDYLGLCEVNPRAKGHRKNLRGAMAALREVGLTSVHVRMQVVSAWPGKKVYLRCIERMLGSAYKKSGPFRVYPVAVAGKSKVALKAVGR